MSIQAELVTASSFESIYDGSEHILTNDFDYIRHEVTVFNTLKVGDVELTACYQTGMSFIRNDYSLRSSELELSDYSTSEVLLDINNLYEIDFENEEYIKDVLADVNKKLPSIRTVADLFELYVFLNDNCPDDIDCYLPEHVAHVNLENSLEA